MIRVEHLSRRFHDLLAVDDVCLHVPRGEILGFLGPNGAGKTTTIRILTGFLPATSGRAQVAGHDVALDSLKVRRQIGYLPENVPVPLDARVDEYIDFRARLKGVPARERKQRREQVLERCGLIHMRRRILGQLSRGYRQRVGLADALVGDPPLLILDEPTGGLDPGQRQDILDLVTAMRGRRTVLLSSHVLAEVEHVCTRIAIIKSGRIVADGTKEEVVSRAGRRGEVRIGLKGESPGRAGDESQPRPALRKLVRWLGEHDMHATIDEARGTCDARIAADDQASALLRAVVEAGFAVDRFEPLTRSLHEIFLELTRAEAS